MRKVTRTTWIGSNGSEFGRVSQAFRNAGFDAPTADTDASNGVYVSNLIEQYRMSLTEREVRSIVCYGLANSLATLRAQHGDYSLEDILRGYDAALTEWN